MSALPVPSARQSATPQTVTPQTVTVRTASDRQVAHERGWPPPHLRLAPQPAPQDAGRLPADDVRPGHDHVTVDPRLRSDMARWVERYAQGVLEVVSGERPPAQLARWTRGDVHDDLSRRAHLVARARNGRAVAPLAESVRALVATVHVSFVTPEVVEAAVHVRHGARRSTALACRFEWRRGRWTCTALEFC